MDQPICEVCSELADAAGADHDPIPYYSLASFFFEGPLPIYATSNDTTIEDDACSTLPEDTPDLSPYVVIVRAGTCDFVRLLSSVSLKGSYFSSEGRDQSASSRNLEPHCSQAKLHGGLVC